MIKVILQSYCICQSQAICVVHILWSIYFYKIVLFLRCNVYTEEKRFIRCFTPKDLLVCITYFSWFVIVSHCGYKKKELFNKSSLQAHSVSHLNLPSGQTRSCGQSNSISNVRTKQQHLSIMGNLLTQNHKVQKKSPFLSLDFSCQA